VIVLDGKELTSGEFDMLVQQFAGSERQEEPSPDVQVITSVAEGRSNRQVELSGRLINGDIVFDTPAPVPVERNTLYVGDTKIILKLRS
jgi:hypothetical protein